MKDESDLRTIGLSGIPALPKKRGRPPTGKALSSAQRIARFREKNSLVTLSVHISSDLFFQLNEFLKFKDKTKDEVIVSLITNQLLRKR